jgi:hypothetical protein
MCLSFVKRHHKMMIDGLRWLETTSKAGWAAIRRESADDVHAFMMVCAKEMP